VVANDFDVYETTNIKPLCSELRHSVLRQAQSWVEVAVAVNEDNFVGSEQNAWHRSIDGVKVLRTGKLHSIGVL